MSTLGFLVISLNQSIMGQSNKKRIPHLSIEPGSSDWTRVKQSKRMEIPQRKSTVDAEKQSSY